MFYQLNNGHLNHPIQLVLEDVVGLLNLTQRETMRDERSSVNLSLLNQAKNFLAIASVDAACLEGEILAIHIGQRQKLWLVVKGHYGHDGIGSGTLPRKAESVIGSCHFEHTVSSTMFAMLLDKILAIFGSGEQTKFTYSY